jgi:hypothetical protein
VPKRLGSLQLLGSVGSANGAGATDMTTHAKLVWWDRVKVGYADERLWTACGARRPGGGVLNGPERSYLRPCFPSTLTPASSIGLHFHPTCWKRIGNAEVRVTLAQTASPFSSDPPFHEACAKQLPTSSWQPPGYRLLFSDSNGRCPTPSGAPCPIPSFERNGACGKLVMAKEPPLTRVVLDFAPVLHT